MEEAFFFNNNTYKLFGILHLPDQEHTKHNESIKQSNCHTGLVFCSPFAEEKLWSHRVFVNFARMLASKGYAVLRFDYMGHGDSEGNFEDSSIRTRISDIAKSVEVLKTKVKVHKIGLLGLRLGATLAAISAEEIKDIDFLILWEPIVKVKEYLQQCFRSSMIIQMALHKSVTQNRKHITQDLLSGKPANIGGYRISGEFYKQASLIDLTKSDLCFPKPVLIVQTLKNGKVSIKNGLKELYENKYKKMNPHSELSVVLEAPFWNETKIYYQEANNIFQETISWLEKTSMR